MNIVERMMRAMPAWMPFTKVNLDNVAAYLYPAWDGKAVVPERDLPTVAPPWNDAVFFWTFPKEAQSFAGVEVLGYVHSDRIVYEPFDFNEDSWRTEKKVNWTTYTGLDDHVLEGKVPEGMELGWRMEMEFYDNDERFSQAYKFDPRVHLPHADPKDGGWPMRVAVYVDSTGQYLGWETGITEPGVRAGLQKEKKLLEWIDQEVRGLSIVILFGLSLMHCKNVSLEEVVPSKKLAKQQLKKRGIPKIRYQVLMIEPMRNVMRRESGKTNGQLPKSLHICRGHFKDYREGAGLFGRYNGIFWWAAYARGSKEEGTVVTDYKVGVVKDERSKHHEEQDEARSVAVGGIQPSSDSVRSDA